MKKLLCMMLIVIVASLSSIVLAGTPINSAEVPKAAIEFLDQYFPGDKLIKAEKEQGRRGMTYEVDLQGGAEIDFRENGDWKEVKVADGYTIPAGIVPEAISKYVTDNFKGLDIVEISCKRGGYELELSNETELKLTKDAKPMPAQSKRRHGNRR